MIAAPDNRGVSETTGKAPCSVSPFGRSTALDISPGPPLTPCCSVHPVPPEGNTRPQAHSSTHDDVLPWFRFAEDVDRGLIWQPDDTRQQRFSDDRPILLENRGLTSPPTPQPVQPPTPPRQLALWKSQVIHAQTIAAKLRTIGLDEQATALQNCHTTYTVCQCSDCGLVRKFPNRCDRFYCPQCASHLAYERQKQVRWWTALIPQPKHVVLTLRNIPALLPGHVDELRRWFTALRRRKFARNWVGGFYRMEVTNEGNGWHLHLHALVNAAWIGQNELSSAWTSITGGIGRIVKVKDTRGADYLSEVTKYVAKAPQIAAWQPAQIAEFLGAFEHKRTFGVFGELYAARTKFAEFIATMKTARPKCSCGSSSCTYFTELEWEMRNLDKGPSNTPRPPPKVAEPELRLGCTPQFPH